MYVNHKRKEKGKKKKERNGGYDIKGQEKMRTLCDYSFGYAFKQSETMATVRW